MKELREEAKRHHEAKLHKYGASHEERAFGGAMKKYAHGGHVHEVDLECKGKTGPEIKRAHGGEASHPNRKKDLRLIEELEHDHMKRGGHVRHRDVGGPISGGGSPRLGRGRKGAGKGKTNVNVMVGKPGGDGAPPVLPSPALGAGPAVPSAPPPRPLLPAGAAPAMGPRPMPAPGAGPMKRGGKVHDHHKRYGHSGHRH